MGGAIYVMCGVSDAAGLHDSVECFREGADELWPLRRPCRLLASVAARFGTVLARFSVTLERH